MAAIQTLHCRDWLGPQKVSDMDLSTMVWTWADSCSAPGFRQGSHPHLSEQELHKMVSAVQVGARHHCDLLGGICLSQ